MRFNDIIEDREAKRYYIEFINYNGYISFDDFMEYEYRELKYKREREHYNFSNSLDFDSVNTSSEKLESKNNYEYRGFFDSVSIEPMSELDRQTYNRWTKEESLQERWNKLR